MLKTKVKGPKGDYQKKIEMSIVKLINGSPALVLQYALYVHKQLRNDEIPLTFQDWFTS